VQVVEDDERAQRELGIERAADRDGEDRVGATGAERRDVGAVGDLAREAQVAVAVARDVDDLGAGEAALGTRAEPKGVATSRGAPASRCGSAYVPDPVMIPIRIGCGSYAGGGCGANAPHRRPD